MKRPGEILLLSTYELGHQPLQLASAAAFLERAGYAPRLLDLAVDPLDEQAVRQARFVGLSVPMHTALRLGMQVAARVRALNPRCHLCFYGLYAPLNREPLAALGASVIGGEYEQALVELVQGLDRGGAPAPPPIALARLDFAAPSRAQLPALDRYARLRTEGEERPAGYLEASRGCKHHCRHCPIPPVYEGRFFIVPESLVIEDARRQVAAGARHLTLGDPDFLNGPKHALRIARALHRELAGVTFDITVKVEHILEQAALFDELSALGCLFVVSAVESLSERVLAILDKGHRRDDVDRALAIVRAAHLGFRPTFVAFTPFTTLDDYLDLIDWIEARGLIDEVAPIQLAIRLLVPPGSKLLELDEVKGALGPLDPERLTYRWSHPDPRMEKLARDAYDLVARASASGEDERLTFARLKRLAYGAAGRALQPPAASPPSGPRHRPPHLSESWFC